MRAVLVLAGLALGGCVHDPVGAIHIAPEAQRVCDYAGQTAPRTDDYSSLRVRAACMRYVRDTGQLPPGLRG